MADTAIDSTVLLYGMITNYKPFHKRSNSSYIPVVNKN